MQFVGRLNVREPELLSRRLFTHSLQVISAFLFICLRFMTVGDVSVRERVKDGAHSVDHMSCTT